MTKKVPVFNLYKYINNNLYKHISLSSYRKILFKEDIYPIYLSLASQVFTLDMLQYRRRRFNIIFQKDETNPKKQLLKKYTSRIVLEFF